MVETQMKDYLSEIAKHDGLDTLDLWPAVRQHVEASQMQANRRLRRHARRTRWVFGVVLMLIVLGGSLAIPSVRVFAQQLLQHFSHAVSDTFAIEFTTFESTDLGLVEQDDIQVTTIEGASARAGFHVKTPTILPDGFALDLILAHDGSPAVTIFYKRSDRPGLLEITQYDPDRVEMLTTCQVAQVSAEAEVAVDESNNVVQAGESVGPIARSNDCASLGDIGTSAEVITVQIGDVKGQYVAGDWRLAEDVEALDDAKAGETVEIEYVWDAEAPVHRLRWEEDDLTYEIVARGVNLTVEDLLLIANDMQ